MTALYCTAHALYYFILFIGVLYIYIYIIIICRLKRHPIMKEGILEPEWNMLSQHLSVDLLIWIPFGMCIVIKETNSFLCILLKCICVSNVSFVFRAPPLGSASLTGRNILASGASCWSEYWSDLFYIIHISQMWSRG